MPNSEAVQDQTPRRAHSRLRLGISARIETLDGKQRVRLLDLSQGGAHIVLSEPHDIRKAVLSWLRFETYGEVVWQEGQHIGLAFDRPLPLACLVETRQRAPTVVREEAMGVEQAARQWVAGTLHQGSER